MNKYLPFFMTIIVFMLVMLGLIYMPYIESISSSILIARLTFSLYIALIIFVILASIWHFENYEIEPSKLKNEFKYDYNRLYDSF